MKPSFLIAIVLSFEISACSSAATVVRKEPTHGLITLQGPYMPAMANARSLMLAHCHGRFATTEQGDHVAFECKQRESSDIVANLSVARAGD